MSAKLKNIIIISVVALSLILVYVFLAKPEKEEESLVSVEETKVVAENESVGNGDDFLSLLLNIKSIKLNDSIFSDGAFLNLKDSSINLIQEGNEGRLNPFAPIGSDIILPITNDINTAPATPPTPPTPPGNSNVPKTN